MVLRRTDAQQDAREGNRKEKMRKANFAPTVRKHYIVIYFLE